MISKATYQMRTMPSPGAQRRGGGLLLVFSLALLLVSLAPAAEGASKTSLSPRTSFVKPEKIEQPGYEHRLIVKFQDDIKARALPTGRLLSRAGRSLDDIDAMADQHGARFSQLISVPDERIAFIEERAALRSGNAQPDLASIMRVEAPEESLQALASALLESPLTEYVYFQELTPPPPTPCIDIPPTTPLYIHLQGYRGPDPGINMLAAWDLGHARGAGIWVADCEYGYNPSHEDLCDIIPEPGQTIHPTVYTYGWDEHGTAVFGQLIGGDNEYGVTGLVPEAQGYFFPEWTVEQDWRRVTAITNAIATMRPGDVVLLEMQTTGPGGGYGPAELDPAVWQVTKAGTDGGVIVVAAAGNGNQNLDSAPYSEYMSRGDSGAIIVGAGTSTVGHNKLGFSTYGSRVNLQGWGQNVFTTGYGSYSEIGGDKNQRYTSTFGGTSSASPIVTAAVVALQCFAVENLSRRLEPLEVRQLLIDTGVPQGSGGHIGPLPDVEAAALLLLDSIIIGDLNGDGCVDHQDLALLLSSYGIDDGGDLNGDGITDQHDLALLLANWGEGC